MVKDARQITRRVNGTVARRGMTGAYHYQGNGNYRVLSGNTAKEDKLGAAGFGSTNHYGNIRLGTNHSGAHIKGAGRHWSPKRASTGRSSG